MKLKNKKTGEIADFSKGYFIASKGYGFVIYKDKDGGRGIEYDSLAELYEEWEDVPEEEPKRYWHMSNRGDIRNIDDEDTDWDNNRKEIGNYFETKEEAEFAVHKLKAWKRLKDKGAEFYGWRRNQTGTYELYMKWEDRIPRSYEVKKDLDLLFGGEDE